MASAPPSLPDSAAAPSTGEQSGSLLRQPKFRNLWAAVEVSFLGMFIHVVAGGWLMTSLTPSETMVSLVQTAYALPIVLFSIMAGTLADTLDRAATMRLSLLFSFAASLAMALASMLGLLTPWLILGLVFAIGAGIALFTPSWQASLGDIASRERLIEAVSLHNMGANAMRTIGPSLGGIMVAGWGATTAFFWGSLSYVPALLLLMLRAPKLSRPAEREAFWPALTLGLRYLAVAPKLELLLLRVFCFSLGAVAVMSLLPLIARQQMGGEVSTYGFLYGGYGAGAIVGGLALKRLRQRFAVETIVRGAICASALAIVMLMLARGLWLGLPATVLAGAAWLMVHSLQNSVLQLSSPRWIVGRMVATFMASAYLGMAFGGWFWGWIAELTLLSVSLAGALTVVLGTLALAWRFPLPDAPKVDMEPLESERVAEENHPLRGGPLYLHIEHDIDPAALADFHRLMPQRRRHLTQLGASHWKLLRDIRNSGRFTESFYVANWQEYRQLMGRRSSETKALRAAAALMQKSRKEPPVRLMLYTDTGLSDYSTFLRSARKGKPIPAIGKPHP